MVRARAQAVNSNRVFIGDEFIKIKHTVVGQSSAPGYLCGGGFLRPSGPEVFRKFSLLSPVSASFCVVHFWYICLSGGTGMVHKGAWKGLRGLSQRGQGGAGVPAGGQRSASGGGQVRPSAGTGLFPQGRGLRFFKHL